MTTMACEICGKASAPDALLFSDRGRICPDCELDLGDAETEQKGRWTAAAGGPLFAFTGLVFTLTGLVPVVGLLAAGVAPFLAIFAIGLGVKAFLRSGETDGAERTLLVIGGAIAVPGGALVLAMSLLMVFSHLVALTTDPYGQTLIFQS